MVGHISIQEYDYFFPTLGILLCFQVLNTIYTACGRKQFEVYIKDVVRASVFKVLWIFNDCLNALFCDRIWCVEDSFWFSKSFCHVRGEVFLQLTEVCYINIFLVCSVEGMMLIITV